MEIKEWLQLFIRAGWGGRVRTVLVRLSKAKLRCCDCWRGAHQVAELGPLDPLRLQTHLAARPQTLPTRSAAWWLPPSSRRAATQAATAPVAGTAPAAAAAAPAAAAAGEALVACDSGHPRWLRASYSEGPPCAVGGVAWPHVHAGQSVVE